MFGLVILVFGNGGSEMCHYPFQRSLCVMLSPALAVGVWAIGICGLMLMVSQSRLVSGIAKLYFSLLVTDLGIFTLVMLCVVFQWFINTWNCFRMQLRLFVENEEYKFVQVHISHHIIHFIGP